MISSKELHREFAMKVFAIFAAATCTLAVAPCTAFAAETTQTIDGTMTVTLQTASSTSSVLAATGDALWMLVAGLALLVAGALFLLRSCRVLTDGSNFANNQVRPWKKTLAIAITLGLLACCFFGTFANRQTAIAAEIISQTKATLVVNEAGTVVESSISIQNNGEYSVTVAEVAAPAELQDWTASVVGESIAAASDAAGTWDGVKIPDDLLAKLTQTGGQLELSYTVTLTCDDGATPSLDFEKFNVDTTAKTYQASQITPSVAAEGYVEGIDYTVTYGENKNAGNQAGTITVKGMGEYAGEKTYTFTIVPKEITISGTKAIAKEYDGTNEVEFDDSDDVIEGLLDGDVVSAQASGTLDDANAGNTTATVDGYSLEGDSAGNYTVATLPQVTATVTPAVCEIEWRDTSFTYDQQIHCPVATVMNAYEADEVAVSVSGAQTSAGTYTATAASLDNPNYTLEGATGVTCEFTIAPAAVAISGIVANEKVYDGTCDATLNFDSVQLSGVFSGDDVAIDTALVKGAFKSKDAGANKLVSISGLALSGSAAGNYELASCGQQKSTTANISKKPVNVSWDAVESYVYNGQEQLPAATAIDVCDGDEVNVVVKIADGKTAKNVGEYTAIASGVDNANYQIGGDSSVARFSDLESSADEGSADASSADEPSKDFKITAATVTVSGISAVNKVYDGTMQADVVYDNAVFKGAVAGDALSVTGEKGTFVDAEKGENKEVALPAYTLTGDAASNYELSADSQTTAYANIAELFLNADKFHSDATDQVYSGEMYKPSVSAEDYIEGVDYRVFYSNNTDANTPSYVAVEGIGNYGGMIMFPFKIAQKTIDVTWSNLEFSYDFGYHVPTAAVDESDVCAGDVVEIEVSGSALSVGKHTATAESKNANYKVSAATESTEYTITDAKYYTVTFDANGHGTAPDALTNVLEGTTISSATCGSATGLRFEGWYTNVSCTDNAKWDFAVSTVTDDVTLYANWVPDSDSDVYWIAPAAKTTTANNVDGANVANKNYVREEWNVKKSSVEIQADVAVLLEGPDNADYERVKAEYESFMTNDDYHLYTKWNGATTDGQGDQAGALGGQTANAYVEFRIIEVGEHDGTEALTFQSTHTLPSAYVMTDGDEASNAGGWVSSALRASMQKGGEIYSNFNSAFTSDIATVVKTSVSGDGSTVVSGDLFFVASVEEMSGVNDETLKQEGEQYAYFKNLSLYNGQYDYNEALERTTRAGNRPAGVSDYVSENGRTWLRTLDTSTTTNFHTVRESGNAVYSTNASTASEGVVLSFAFGIPGANLVQFDTQGHGSAVSPQFVAPGDTVFEPTSDDYGSEMGLEFEGWYTSANCKPNTKWSFATAPTSNITLYANWVLDPDAPEGNAYWIGPSYKTVTSFDSCEKLNKDYVSETTNVLKTQFEIEEDVAKIRAGDKATIAEYTEYMYSDKYHLYSNWLGDDVSSTGRHCEKNRYIECRILQVGEHDGDGSAITFQTTHMLQTAWHMNSTRYYDLLDTYATYDGGWKQSEIRADLQYGTAEKRGGLSENFSNGLIDDIKTVTKTSIASAGSYATTTTQDEMWLLSFSEITGDTNSTYSPGSAQHEGYVNSPEGSQYAYYKNLCSEWNFSVKCEALQKKTRYGNTKPANSTTYYPVNYNGSGHWWLRTPDVRSTVTCSSIDSDGMWRTILKANSNIGIIVCFAF